MTEITNFRHNHLIDPHLEIWEWQIPLYLFVGGLVAGLMILGGIWRLMGKEKEGRALLFYGPLTAPILLSLGMVFLLLDLAYPEHVFRFYTTFEPLSPMSWGSWILLFVYPAQILALALPNGLETFKGKLRFLNPIWNIVKNIAGKAPKQIAWINVIGGASLGIYTGILLGTVAARPLWNSAVLPPLFLVSGFSAACAFGLLAKPTSNEIKNLFRWDIAALIIEVVLLGSWILSLITGPTGSINAANLILGGPFTASFWVFVVFVGIALPLWLEFREMLHRPVPVWVGPALVLVGGLALRFVIVMAGQVSHFPEIEPLISNLH